MAASGTGSGSCCRTRPFWPRGQGMTPGCWPHTCPPPCCSSGIPRAFRIPRMNSWRTGTPKQEHSPWPTPSRGCWVRRGPSASAAVVHGHSHGPPKMADMTEQAGDRGEGQHTQDLPGDHGTGPLAGRLEQVIAAQVRHYRTTQGLSSAELAARTGMSKAMVSRVETATTSCSLTTLQRLADGLNVPVTALFRGADTDRHATFTKSGQGSLTVRS